MRLTESSVAIRPRSPWEAIDLGVLLAGRHRGLLMGSWAIVTLPFFCLLSLLLWEYPSAVIFLFWWLKPAFERLPLLILSQSLFGATPTLRQALKAWPGTLKSQLLPSLLWRRLSLSRSFQLPVQQLEHLDGTERAIRIGLLSQKDLRAARMLTVVGAHLEYSLWIGLLILLYALIPQQVQVDWHWMNLLGLESPQLWIDHLTNLFYALALVLWEPVYVACGFTLYLNRRTVLEAWDIELVFRRLRQRLIGSAYVLLIGVGLGLSIAPAPAWADPQEYSCPLPDRSEVHATPSLAAPDTPRLTRQTLTSDASRHKINEVLQQPPFKNLKTETGWRFPEKKQPGKPSGREHHDQGWLIKWLDRLMLATHGIARFVEVLLWAAVLGLSGLLIWRYRRWVTTFVSRGTGRKKAAKPRPDQLFGLQVSAESLPDDVAGQAEQLWNSQPREALGLLYRALLSRLLTDYRLPLKNADTEGQVLQRIASLNQPLLSEFSQTLTRHWQALAYGHRLPPAHLRQELCDGWRRLFGSAAKS
ncbi:DUF4129 domain-containing protein [Pseudomonas cannabina]|uniref:DUF4129 domain-containing protein n=2 Tax=Pseudomonas syringae group TaxID=136849 RepID=A0A8T8C617_PSEYM|nr:MULTISPECIES: DUF4129 domain-containing protein [Pseudomonas syringae group]KPB72977.1 Uncharacterized protein AC507_0735 [Pseudomonas syringae pv. maculicola]MBM0138826.1 DUF4129 domain-containing protein [Pseudomonas cannabina pv. alisalensis]QHE98806.1 DUF4129 domain-containing protein [Pseudomonas syringae pv. maculicola str. ES4326]QQN21068.1 DUF4129 domain-containing protein [Pseudomonas cannabina pv. alisalensis]UBY99468.1 DUF4129 domain-containing protein [Pseudomonas cannabina pv. 